MRPSDANMRRGVTIAAAVFVAAMCGTSSSQAAKASAADGATRTGSPCAPAQPGRPKILLERVPQLMSARMTAARDGGAVIAFSSFRGSREFRRANFSVLAVDSSGCVRWRASLPGPWPIASPVQPNPNSIVVASAWLDLGDRIPGGLRIYTLSAATGRVLHRDVFPSLSSVTGFAPTLLSDRRGDVAAVLATNEPSGPPRGSTPVTLKLTRRAHATRWSRQVIARSNTRPPAAVARPNGKTVVGYPRRGRFWVHTGTVAGRLGPPMDAGPVSSNFQGAAVALGQNGTIGAVWQSASSSDPWRLRAAVRPARGKRFARFAQLGLATSFFADGSPVVHVSADGQVTAGSAAPNGTPGGRGVICANATPAGQFGPAHQVAAGGPFNPLDQAAMIFGPADSAAIVASTPDGDALVNSLVTVDAGCKPRSPELLDPGTGAQRQAVIDSRARIWVLGQPAGGVSHRGPLLLTITAPIR
jgi:hypothetical protein